MYEIVLATHNRRLMENFKGVISREGLKFDTINDPAQLSNIFHQKGKILEVMILDLNIPEKELNRLIFYIRQYKKDVPVFLLSVEAPLIKESEALQNLSVYGFKRLPNNRAEAQAIVDDLNKILELDMDKKFQKLEYLKEERVFSCTFKNRKTFFLTRKDIPEDDGKEVQSWGIDKGKYHFWVKLVSGKKYEVVWDYVRAMCDENYEYYRNNQFKKMTSGEIGKRITEIRKIRKLTQEVVAEKSGIKRANIARIESGKHSPSLETLEKIAKVFFVPVSVILTSNARV